MQVNVTDNEPHETAATALTENTHKCTQCVNVYEEEEEEKSAFYMLTQITIFTDVVVIIVD